MNSNEVKQTEQDVLNPSEKKILTWSFIPPSAVYMRRGDGFSPVRRQSITWTSADLQSSGPLGTNFSEIVIKFKHFNWRYIWKCRLQFSYHKWNSIFILDMYME